MLKQWLNWEANRSFSPTKLVVEVIALLLLQFAARKALWRR